MLGRQSGTSSIILKGSQPGESWHHLGCASNMGLARGTGGNTHCIVPKCESRPRTGVSHYIKSKRKLLSVFFISEQVKFTLLHLI